MFRRTLISLAIVCSAVAVTVAASRPTSLAAGPALKSVHLINLPASVPEAEFVAAINNANAVIAKTGYPNAGYSIWKVVGTQNGAFAYLYEGHWPSQAAYDSIHAHPLYKASNPRFDPIFQTVMKGQVYNRYQEVSLKPAK